MISNKKHPSSSPNSDFNFVFFELIVHWKIHTTKFPQSSVKTHAQVLINKLCDRSFQWHVQTLTSSARKILSPR